MLTSTTFDFNISTVNISLGRFLSDVIK